MSRHCYLMRLVWQAHCFWCTCGENISQASAHENDMYNLFTCLHELPSVKALSMIKHVYLERHLFLFISTIISSPAVQVRQTILTHRELQQRQHETINQHVKLIAQLIYKYNTCPRGSSWLLRGFDCVCRKVRQSL